MRTKAGKVRESRYDGGGDTLERARAGDPMAFADLLKTHDAGLRALAFRLLGDRSRMDDVLQEAYLTGTAYDAVSGRMVELVAPGPGARPDNAVVRTGLGPGEPDAVARPVATGDFDDLAALVLAKVQAGDGDVEEVTVEGHRACVTGRN